MSGWLFNLLDRLPSWSRRWMMIVLPLALVSVLVTGFALAPQETGRHPQRASATGRFLPPTPAAAAQAPAQTMRTAAVMRPRTRSRAADHSQIRGPVNEGPLAPPPSTAEGMLLAVARRFAMAYMPYQVGRLPGWARTAIERTCTPAFARSLLAQPAQPTVLQAANPDAIETYRVARVEPAGAPDTVAVTYVSVQDRADSGEFLLGVVDEHGRWLVSGLKA